MKLLKEKKKPTKARFWIMLVTTVIFVWHTAHEIRGMCQMDTIPREDWIDLICDIIMIFTSTSEVFRYILWDDDDHGRYNRGPESITFGGSDGSDSNHSDSSKFSDSDADDSDSCDSNSDNIDSHITD